jgi:hypothetical protein
LEVAGGRCLEPARAALDDAVSLSKANDIAFLPSLRVNRFSDQWMRFDERYARERALVQPRRRSYVRARSAHRSASIDR